jgi:hypothetical protein
MQNVGLSGARANSVPKWRKLGEFFQFQKIPIKCAGSPNYGGRVFSPAACMEDSKFAVSKP